MNAVNAAVTELQTAIGGVEVDGRKLRRTGPGDSLDPPAFVVAPPAVRWETLCAPPTTATFIVYVIVARNGREIEVLTNLLLPVVEAIESETNGAVSEAFPGVYPLGELPCYQLTVEYDL